MRNVRCADCDEYRNEWCEKVIDSPHPDMLRDCQYYHEKDRDVIRVVRCKDCKHKQIKNMVLTCPFGLPGGEDFFCGYDAEPYKGE